MRTHVKRWPIRDDLPASWLTNNDAEAAARVLGRLADWLRAVYLQYRGAELVECWYWHPDVVAELLALYVAWLAAYDDEASPTAAVDWHDRHRPGVVGRVTKALMGCGLSHHSPTGDQSYRSPRLPIDLAAEVAAWWASTRGAMAAPPPTAAMLAEADAYRRAQDEQQYGRR